MKPAATAQLEQAYQEADRDQRVHHSKVGCVLALILVPLFWGLDWVVYPQYIWPLLEVRLLCNLGVALLLGLLCTPLGRRYISVLGISWALVPAAAIAWMIYLTEGAMSPYYAGLNLAMIIVCLLMPWTFVEVVVQVTLVLAFYLVACILHTYQEPLNYQILTSNLYFMIATGTICAVAGYIGQRRRFEDFRLRHELDARNRELAELDRLKSEFFANISHELRTPLTLILAPIEDLLNRGNELSGRAVEALSLTKQNALRLLKLINDLLEVVRLDARRGKPELHLRTVDLTTCLPGLADSLRHIAGKKSLHLAYRGEPGPLLVTADPSGLEKVVVNLLTNAIKFTPPGGRIDVTLRRDGRAAEIEVRDSGIGIPVTDLPHIFDRFRQVDGSSTRRFQGVGLGLALVRELVEEHRGELGVESAVGKGTTFRIRLPLADAAAAGTHDPAASRSDNAERDADPFARTFRDADRFDVTIAPPVEVDLSEAGDGEHTVLVVDDEPDMRRFLVTTLADTYRVLQAADGERALTVARGRHPDLIVLDLMLPGIDGLEVCRLLRAEPSLSDTRIVLLTARADESSKLEALRYGADDFLTKPFSTLEVRTRLENLLRTAQLQKDLRQRNRELQSTIRELETTRNKLVQSEKMSALGSLAAGLLHEINNPLNYTLAALQLLRGTTDENDADLQDTLNDIDEGMKRIRDIVTDLRAFAYPEKLGRQDVIDIEDIVETSLRFTAHARNDVAIETRYASQRDVLGSRSHIVQVLVNLISNAMKAVDPVRQEREPKIRIFTEVEEDRLLVHVRDNGIGMSNETLSRIFDPFFTTRDVGEGMGLGLSICQTIIEQHGGSIRAQSQEGQWTQTTFDLALAPQDEPTEPDADEPDHPAGASRVPSATFGKD